MSDTKRKISAWVPAVLYDDVEKAGYTSPTIAVTKALELLVKTEHGDNQETNGDKLETNWRQLEIERNSLKDEVERLSISLRTSPDQGEFSRLQIRSEELERQIKVMEENLRKTPDPIEFAQLRTRSEELEKHNLILKGEMEKQLEFLKGQITIKDQQIEKQAFSLQSVIQENSRLNLKLLPEAQETKNTQEQKLTRWQHLKIFVFGSQ
jgi:hypothetical protein